MKNERDSIVLFLEEQLRLSTERERSHLEQNEQLSKQIAQLSRQNVHLSDQLSRLTVQIEEQSKTIDSLKEALLQKNRDVSSLSGKNRGMAKILSNTSEKITSEQIKQQDGEKSPVPAKERGNNGARRKSHICMEEQIIDIWPDDPEFDRGKAIELKVVESIRYEYLPSRVIKRIIRQHNCVVDNKVYTVCSPRTPFMNSNYEASFIAALLQFRYTYSMPVERIVKFFVEGGFALEKATAHSLIGKAALLLENLDEVLRKAIHTDPYIRMDETYHRIVNEERNVQGKATRKGYLWSAMANTLQLVHFFYKEGSRGKDVFSGYLDKSYKGAVHTDGLVCYKEIESSAYPDAIRISCFQHAKRKFLDMEADTQAKEIVDHINRLYRIEHDLLLEQDAEKKLACRNREALPILRELKEKLYLITNDPATLPSTPLSVATHYMLNEFGALENYLLDAVYTLDNNAIERANRYISLNRRNSLFFGSHNGAKRSALLFSLSCSCRLHNINSYEYFTDILSRMAYLPPNIMYPEFRTGS